MGNVSDKISDDSRSSPTLESSTPLRLESSFPSNGDQSSCSLEWFDAPESMTAGSSPAIGGSVFVNAKINLSRDEVDSFFKTSTVPRKSEFNPSLESHFHPSSSLDLEPKNSSTSRFLGSPRRSLIKCLDHQPYEIHRKESFSLVPPPKVEEQTGEREKEEEGMKPPTSEMDGEMKRHTEKRNINEETEADWNQEKGVEEVEKYESGNDNKEVNETGSSSLSSSTPPTSSSSSTVQLLLPSNTPDVLSDIPSAILLDSPPPPLTPTSSISSSSSPPTTSFDENDDLTDDTTPSNPADVEVEMMKKQKKKNRKKARQLTKVNQKERQSRQRLDADRIREERLKKEQELTEAAVVKGISRSFLQQEETEEEQQKENEVSVEKNDVGAEANSSTSNSFLLPRVPSTYPTSDFRYSTSSSSEDDLRLSEESFEEITMVVRAGSSKETLVDSNVEVKETFKVVVDGQIREVSPFVPRNRQSSSGEDALPPPSQSSSSSGNSVYDIPEHPPLVVPFRDAPIINTSSSHLPKMNAPPPSFVSMPMTFNPQQQPPPPIMVSSYGPTIPQRMISIPQPPIPGFIPPPGVAVMQHVPLQRMNMSNNPMYFAPAPGIPMHPPPIRIAGPPPPPMVRIGPPMPPPPPQFRALGPPPPMMAHPIYPQPPPPPRQILQPIRRRPLTITAPPPPVNRTDPSCSSSTSSANKSSALARSSKNKKKPDVKKVQTYVEKNMDQQPCTSGDSSTSISVSGSATPSSSATVVIAEEEVVEEEVFVKKEPVVQEEPEKAMEPVEPVKQNEQVVVETDVKREVEEQSENVKIKEEEVSIVEPVFHELDPHIPEPPGLERNRRIGSFEAHGEVLHSLVAAVLSDSDDEFPPAQSSSTTSSASQRPLSPTSETQQKGINRVLEFTKELENGRDTNGIWGEERSKPTPMPPPHDANFCKITEDGENKVLASSRTEDVRKRIVPEDEDEKKVTFLSICKKLEPFFEECGDKWRGARIDSEQLRAIFIEAYGGQIPRDHWAILEKLCTFQPGYLNVFDAIIGSQLDWTYSFVSTPEFMQDKGCDELYQLYQSMPPVDGVDNFFKRFEQMITSDLIKVLSNRFVSVRTFVAIVEIVCELTTCDLYYLATLVFGSRQFMAKFNARIKHIQLSRNGGKIWVRQTMMDPLQNNKHSHPPEERMKTVGEFLTRLRPYINDLLQYLPDAVVNDEEFFKAAKLICNWNGDDEERVWKSIVKDRTKFQEFLEAYQPFLRIEIRMGAIYLRKLTYEDDYDTDGDEDPMNMISKQDEDVNLISSIKSDESVNRKEKKSVSYAAEIELITPDAPPEPTGRNRSSQTDNLEMNQLWDLEREVIRLLKQDNIPFAEFIKTENAREMYQFLIDQFKERDLHHFAFILEKTLTETREESWREMISLRNAAEEARIQLEMAREEHKKEYGDLKSRMETISRFEAYEVQVASNSRIEGLKEHINQLTQDRNVMLREEVKEERARVQRQIRELKEKHAEEKRVFAAEIARLKEENAQLLTGRQELGTLHGKHEEKIDRSENQMIKAKTICENSSRLLLESQREIESLREAVLNTPDSQPDFVDIEIPDLPSTSSSPASSSPSTSPCSSSSPPTVPPLPPSPRVELSSDAVRELKIIEKYSAEFQPEKLLTFARDLFNMYNNSKANHKERKTAEKQLKEFEAAIEFIENTIKENIQMIKLNVVEGLLPIPEIPQPFSDTVMKKMFEYSGLEQEAVEKEESIPEEENVCLICTDPVEETCESIKCCTCSKEYHYHCIQPWLKINSVCPACSRALKDPNEYPMLE